MATQRLDKLLAGQGMQSRKEVKAVIAAGRVTVDGVVIKAGDCKVNRDTQQVAVDGKAVDMSEHIYLMLHKPQGVLSATEDKRQPTVVDLVPSALRRKGLFPAGRLDKDTEGFVLLTDDGAFAHRILSPKNHIPKRYFARLDGPVGEDLIQAFAQGMELGEGDASSAAQLTILESGETSQVEVVIYEGFYHQIKRMFLHYGLTVTYLKRLQMGGLPLDEALPLGECRPITPEELSQLLGETGAISL